MLDFINKKRKLLKTRRLLTQIFGVFSDRCSVKIKSSFTVNGIVCCGWAFFVGVYFQVIEKLAIVIELVD